MPHPVETTYDLPRKAYDKSRDRNLVLNADKFLFCTRAAGKRFDSEITQTSLSLSFCSFSFFLLEEGSCNPDIAIQ